MKLTFCVSFLAALLLSGCEYSSKSVPNVVKVQKIDADTKLKSEYFAYTDAKGREVKHGIFIAWYGNGQKYIDANYDRGELDGKCTIFTEEGKPEVEGVYRHGQPWDGEIQVGHEIRKYSAGKLLSSRTDEK